MGYKTPNIDRIAKEGMLFTDSYGEQSCTAGRSSFITGQSVYRTGLSKVGIPAAPIGMNDKLVTIAALLKEQGYATGQFGKNHLGDLNHMLPTNHGFDEFFGNLYHLNAEEEPEMDNYPAPGDPDMPNFRKNFGPRGVMHSWATDKDDKTVEPRWGKVGKQKIEDTGPLTKKRMETCDDDFSPAPRLHQATEQGRQAGSCGSTPPTYLFTHTKKSSLGRPDAGSRLSTMIVRQAVGQMLDCSTARQERHLVQYTDNGPHRNSWPDGGMTPFAARRTPTGKVPSAFAGGALARQDQGRFVCNDIIQHRLAAHLLAMA
jgi:arylsulfatase